MGGGIAVPLWQSYKASTIIIYDSRVVPDLKIPHIIDPRVVIYKPKMFIRLATDFFARIAMDKF